MNDEKTDRFKRIAEKRTNSVLNDLRLLGNTANRNTYTYTDEQVDKIFGVIESRIGEVKAKFSRRRHDKFEL